MSQKIYLWILKGGVLFSFIIFFFVFKNLLFPFITSKQLPFNILVEILTVFWLAFLVKYPEYRPKFNHISISLVAFITAIFITCFTGVDFNLSFWGDVERMLGVWHVIHFILYYFIIITVFRSKEDWKMLFGAILAVSVLISIDSLVAHSSGDKPPYSTIGNTAYVSGLLIFAMYFAGFLFANTVNPVLKIIYVLSLFVILPAFWKLNTSGAYIGLAISFSLLLVLFGILNNNKKIRITTFSLLAIFVLILSLIFGSKNSSWVQNNSSLKKLTFLISFNKPTFQTRLISWKAAFKDFKTHPVLGTGFGNYAIIFDEYFTSDFYNYTRGETYFDRAHNNIIDIASTSGLVGIIAYLSIFVATAYYLIRSWRQGCLETKNFIIIVAVITGYFIQNLAIFDSFVTYICLMITLGYVFWVSENQRKEPKDRPLENKEFYVLIGMGLIALFTVYQYGIKPWKMLIGTIDGQRASASGIEAATIEYKKALSYNTVLDRDSRTTFIRLVNGSQDQLIQMKKTQKGDKANEILDYAISLAEANLTYNQKDNIILMETAQLFNVAAIVNSDDPEKFSYYIKQAEDMVNRSIDASPGRATAYFPKAQILLTQNKLDEAIETIKYAVSLNPQYPDTSCQLAKLYFYAQKEKEGLEAMNICIDYKVEALYPENFVRNMINRYAEVKDWPRTLFLYEKLTKLNPKDKYVWINLAKLYAQQNMRNEAINAALKAAELDPGIKNEVDKFINNLK